MGNIPKKTKKPRQAMIKIQKGTHRSGPSENVCIPLGHSSCSKLEISNKGPTEAA